MYEYFMKQFDRYTSKAQAQKDENLKRFYLNATQGFKAKAMRLTLETA